MKVSLPLRKSSFNKAKILIDIANDKITIFNKEIDLHYCIDIYPTKTEKENYEKALTLEKDLTNKEGNNARLLQNDCEYH